MNFLSGIPILGKIIDGAFNIIDQKVEDKDLAIQIKSEIAKQVNDQSADFEKEVTKRWTSDKDGILTSNIRPIAFLSVLVLFFSMVLCDGNIGGFKVNPAYIPVIETLLATMVIAYFGSRGIEKTTKIFKKNSGTKDDL